MASINLQSKDGGGDDGSRSPIRSRGVSSPWTKIVRGDSDEFSPPLVSVASPSFSSLQDQIVNPSSDWYPPKAVTETASSPDDSGTECQPEGSDNGGGGSNAVKKPVWSKPSNGVVEAVSPVMGAVSWPALGESTKAAPKSSSSESLQALSDGSSLPALPVTGNSSPSSLKLANPNIVNPTSTPNHVAHSGQRSMRRGGVNSGAYLSSNGGVSQRSPVTQDSKVEVPHNASGKPAAVAMESQRGGFGAQSNSGGGGGGNDHHQQPHQHQQQQQQHHHQRNSYRRGNGRGDGSFQGRGNQEWNQHRNYNNNSSSRENTSMQAQRGFRRGGYMRPTVHTSTPFVPPQMHMAMRPFPNNVMYPPEMAPGMFYYQSPVTPESLRSMPLVPPLAPPPIYFPFQDPNLPSKIVTQIDYYFSNENLVKDIYLRQQMDEQGWVPINVIANFKKVSSLTDNIPFILDAMRASTLVEVQGDKLRRRNDWMKWLMPPPAQYSSPVVTPRSVNQDTLTSQFQGIVLNESTEVNAETFTGSGGEGGIHRSSQQERATVV